MATRWTRSIGAHFMHDPPRGPRSQPFHPAMRVEGWIHAYITGVFSSCKIARKLHEDVAFRVLGAGNFPKHHAICDFRANPPLVLADRLVQVGQLAREMQSGQTGHPRGGGHPDRQHVAPQGPELPPDERRGRRAQGGDRCFAQARPGHRSAGPATRRPYSRRRRDSPDSERKLLAMSRNPPLAHSRRDWLICMPTSRATRMATYI